MMRSRLMFSITISSYITYNIKYTHVHNVCLPFFVYFIIACLLLLPLTTLLVLLHQDDDSMRSIKWQEANIFLTFLFHLFHSRFSVHSTQYYSFSSSYLIFSHNFWTLHHQLMLWLLFSMYNHIYSVQAPDKSQQAVLLTLNSHFHISLCFFLPTQLYSSSSHQYEVVGKQKQ